MQASFLRKLTVQGHIQAVNAHTTLSTCRRLLHPASQVHSSRAFVDALRATLVASPALQHTMPRLCSPSNAHKHAAWSAGHQDTLDECPQKRFCFQAVAEMESDCFQIRSLLLSTAWVIA